VDHHLALLWRLGSFSPLEHDTRSIGSSESHNSTARVAESEISTGHCTLPSVSSVRGAGHWWICGGWADVEVLWDLHQCFLIATTNLFFHSIMKPSLSMVKASGSSFLNI
jgi:hypothetical protein